MEEVTCTRTIPGSATKLLLARQRSVNHSVDEFVAWPTAGRETRPNMMPVSTSTVCPPRGSLSRAVRERSVARTEGVGPAKRGG